MANLKKSLKRGMAALLAVCLVLTSFNGVAWASETPGGVGPDEDVPAKFVLKYDANEFIEAAQEAIASGEIYAADEMEFAKSDYNKLFNDSESTVFEFYPEERVDEDEEEVSSPEEDIAALSDVLGADVRMFIRVNGWDAEAEEEYVMTGEEEIIFLFINALEEKLTFQIDINGFITKEITVPGNTSSLGGFGSATGSNADTKAPGNKVDTNVPGKNDGTTAPAVPETTPAEQPATEATESTPAEQPITEAVETTPAETTEAVTDPTETLPVESSEAESVEETTAAADVTEPAESADSTEASTEAEAESSTAASEEAATEAVVETEETTEAQSEAATEAATEEPATVEATEAEPEAPAAEEPATEAEPVITMSRNEVPVVGSAPEVEDDDEEVLTDEEALEEGTTTEVETGKLPGTAMSASKIVEEEITSKAFITKSSDIMKLLKASAGGTLQITHKLSVIEQTKLHGNSFTFIYEEVETLSFDELSFEAGKYNYGLYNAKQIKGLQLKDDINTTTVLESDFNGSTVKKVTLEYSLASGHYIVPWEEEKDVPANASGSYKLNRFPQIVDHDGRYPIYMSANIVGPFFGHPHDTKLAEVKNGTKVCQSKQEYIDAYGHDPSKHYVLLSLTGGNYDSDDLTYIRCDKYRNEQGGKYYWNIGFLSETGADIDRITVEQKKEGNSIKNTHPDYELPTVDKEGNYIVGWYAEGDSEKTKLSPEMIRTLMINEDRNFIAIIGEEPDGAGTLTIEKKVIKGAELANDLSFAFQLELKLNGAEYAEPIVTSDGQTYNAENGIYHFGLENSESITFVELPVGLQYIVSENDKAGNEYVSSALDGIIIHSGNAVKDGNSATGTITMASTAGEGVWMQQDFEYNDNSIVISREKMLTDAEKIKELVERAGSNLGEGYTYTEYYPISGGGPVDIMPEQIARTEVYKVSWAAVTYKDGNIGLQVKGNDISGWKQESFSSADSAVKFLMARYEFDETAENLQSLLAKKTNISLYIDPNVKPSGKEGRLYVINHTISGQDLYKYISKYYESLGYKSKSKTGQETNGNNFMYTVIAVPGYSKKVTYSYNPTTVNTGSNDYIIFNNALTANTVKLQIQKTINKNMGEDPTFIFKVENTDANSAGFGQVFHVQITMENGKTTANHVMDSLPAGIYEITEFEHMRYHCADVKVIPEGAGTVEPAANKATVKAISGECTVSFSNALSGSNYFTNTDVIINKVVGNEDGGYHFEAQNADGTSRKLPIMEARALDLAILPGKQKSFDDPENFGDDVPFSRC